MLGCVAAVGVILGTSQNKFRNEWPVDERWEWLPKKGKWMTKAQIEPHVLLAIVNTISNVALAIAIGQGVAIAWWRRAMQGSTVMVGSLLVHACDALMLTTTSIGPPSLMGLCNIGT